MATSLLWSSWCLTASPSADAAVKVEANRFKSTNSVSASFQVPEQKPRWTIRIGKPEATFASFDRVAAAGKYAYYLRAGRLYAADLTTGRTAWSTGSKLYGPIVATTNYVIVGSQAGTIFKFNSANGRTLWRFTAKNKPILNAEYGTDLYTLTKNTLFIRLSDAIVSLDLNTGKPKWTFSMEPTGSLKVLGDIVLAHEISSGAITSQPVVAIDAKTGKLKWRLNGSFGPLLENNGNKLYFENIWPRNDLSKYEFKMDVYDASSGKKLESKEYLPLAAGADPLVTQAQQVALNGFFLYLQADSGAIYKFDVRESSPITAKPMIEKADWLAGPYDGKLFLRTEHTAGIRSLLAEDLTEQVFEGLDNSVNVLRLNQSAAIVGQTDGELYVLHLATGKSVFRFQTGASVLRSTTISGNQLIVETEDQLLLFDLPTELQKAPVAPTLANSLKKADVSLQLNSKKITLSAPVMTHKNEYFLPAKELLERMGGALSVDNNNETYRFLYGERIVSFNSGQMKALVNEKSEPLQFEAVDVKSVLYLSAKDFERLTGASVVTDTVTRTVSVQTKTAASK